MLPGDIETVCVPVFRNETTEPLIEDETTRAAIAAFQTDGSLRVTNRDRADAVLDVVLTDYAMAPLAYRKDRPTAADEYRITITSRLVLTRAGTGEVLAESPRVQGEATFLLEGDMTSSKRRVLPIAAADLAHDIVETVVEYW
jgi:hypothetical protein